MPPMIEMKMRLRTIAVLSLFGTPSYLLCYESHVCMAGHMHHGPYPLYEWVSDILWMVCFAAVLVFSLRLRARGRIYFLCGSIVLMLFRIPLGSLGGGSIIFELPVLILMDVLAIKYLMRLEKYVISGGQDMTTHIRPDFTKQTQS